MQSASMQLRVDAPIMLLTFSWTASTAMMKVFPLLLCSYLPFSLARLGGQSEEREDPLDLNLTYGEAVNEVSFFHVCSTVCTLKQILLTHQHFLLWYFQLRFELFIQITI